MRLTFGSKFVGLFVFPTMVLRLTLNSLLSRFALPLGVLFICAILLLAVVQRFTIGTLTSRHLSVNRGMLAWPASYLPDSPRLNARLAEAELAEGSALADAEFHARRAIDLSPFDYRNRVILAMIEESGGDREGAAEALREAERLAPNNRNVRWRLANVLLRAGKLNESLPKFRDSLRTRVSQLPGALDLIWRATGGSVDAVRAITADEGGARLILAQFLVSQSRYSEAIQEFSKVSPSERLAAPHSQAVINSLMTAGKYDLARNLWTGLVENEASNRQVWNGGFETDAIKNFNQFDWALARSDFARASIDPSIAHGGSRSARIDFTGRDTTTLDNELKQVVVVRPGTRYVVSCWVKTSSLVSPEAPRLVVSDVTSSKWLATSDPIPTGSSEWRRIAIDFIAPEGSPAVHISLKRKPKFSYDEPTTGTVWLDDVDMSPLQ